MNIQQAKPTAYQN